MRGHSGLMLANLTTFAHFSVSSATILPNSAGEPAISMPPMSSSFALRRQPLALTLPLKSIGIRHGSLAARIYPTLGGLCEKWVNVALWPIAFL